MTATTIDAACAAPEPAPVDALRKECRAMARRRAALAAATSLIPLPGIDLATDLAMMTRLIKRINEHFGLSEAQIERLPVQRQALLYRLLASAGPLEKAGKVRFEVHDVAFFGDHSVDAAVGAQHLRRERRRRRGCAEAP